MTQFAPPMQSYDMHISPLVPFNALQVVPVAPRFGLVGSSYPFSRCLDTALLAEKNGFDSIWFGDHLALPFSPSNCLDTWTVFGALAMETNWIKLGMSVTDPVRKHPAVLAQTSATVDILSKGRMILGIGAGEAMNLEPYGISWERPVARMRETIKIVKKLWSDDQVDYDGEFYKLRSAFVNPKPVQKPHLPIWVGANSRLALRLTGELGDGWIPTRTTPETLASDLKLIRKRAEEVGRNAKQIEVAPHAFTLISRSRDVAREALTRVRPYLLFTPKRVEQLGYAMPTHEFDLSRLLCSADIEKKFREKAEEVPIEAAEEIAIWGTPDDCISKIERFIEAGATHLVLALYALPDKQIDDAINLIGKKVIPYFREKK